MRNQLYFEQRWKQIKILIALKYFTLSVMEKIENYYYYWQEMFLLFLSSKENFFAHMLKVLSE